jgi:thioredoxin-related protein
MKKEIITIAILGLLVLPANAQQSFFKKITWENAKSLAQRENKNIFVDVYTSWCGPCKKMASTVFIDPKVNFYMEKNFVSISLDAEKEKDSGFFKLFKASGFPSFYWLDSSGSLLDSKVGYMPVDSFIKASTASRNNNLGKLYKEYISRWKKGDRSETMVNSLLFDIMPKFHYDSVRIYLNEYLSGLSEEKLKSRKTGEMLQGFMATIKDDKVWRTAILYSDTYQKYFGYNFGKKLYMNLVRVPMIDRKDSVLFKQDMSYITKMNFSNKDMYLKLIDMEKSLFNGQYASSLENALNIGNQYEKDYPYLYSEMFYTFIIAGFFEDKYVPSEKELKDILTLGQKSFDMLPSQCTILYLAAAYARNNNYKKAYELMASLPFYGEPVLSSAVYRYLNLYRVRAAKEN